MSNVSKKTPGILPQNTTPVDSITVNSFLHFFHSLLRNTYKSSVSKGPYPFSLLTQWIPAHKNPTTSLSFLPIYWTCLALSPSSTSVFTFFPSMMSQNIRNIYWLPGTHFTFIAFLQMVLLPYWTDFEIILGRTMRQLLNGIISYSLRPLVNPLVIFLFYHSLLSLNLDLGRHLYRFLPVYDIYKSFITVVPKDCLNQQPTLSLPN